MTNPRLVSLFFLILSSSLCFLQQFVNTGLLLCSAILLCVLPPEVRLMGGSDRYSYKVRRASLMDTASSSVNPVFVIVELGPILR